MLTTSHLAFLDRCRIGHLATADLRSVPHIVPVCFAAGESALYTPLDDKPKSGRELKRLKNIRENPRATFLADRYDEDWSKLGWLRLDGHAELLSVGNEFSRAVLLLEERYAQYRAMRISGIMALRITFLRAWGNLDS